MCTFRPPPFWLSTWAHAAKKVVEGWAWALPSIRNKGLSFQNGFAGHRTSCGRGRAVELPGPEGNRIGWTFRQAARPTPSGPQLAAAMDLWASGPTHGHSDLREWQQWPLKNIFWKTLCEFYLLPVCRSSTPTPNTAAERHAWEAERVQARLDSLGEEEESWLLYSGVFFLSFFLGVALHIENSAVWKTTRRNLSPKLVVGFP